MPHDDLILLEEDFHRLNVALTKLIDKARLDCALLINKSGRMLTSQSESGNIDKTSLSALVVGSFVSTTNIASMLGETEFNSMFHQGNKKNIRVSLVDDNTLLTVIFDNRTSVEKVKLFTTKYTEELKDALARAYANVISDPFINLDVLPKGHSASQKQPSPVHNTQNVNDDTSSRNLPRDLDLETLEQFDNPD